MLVRETQAVVQEALEAFADAVIFKSSLGTGKGDFIQALNTLAEGGVYFPEEIRRFGSAQAPNPKLPPLIEELSDRELDVVAGVAAASPIRRLQQPRYFSGNRKTHVVNAKDKLV